MDKLVTDIYNDVTTLIKQPHLKKEHRMIIDDFINGDG